jgi:hypothetical protein
VTMSGHNTVYLLVVKISYSIDHDDTSKKARVDV